MMGRYEFMSDSNEANSQRRDFFRQAVGRIIGPIARRLEVRDSGSSSRPNLRPPGAIAESLFESRCQRSGCCVSACPANAIFLPSPTGAEGTDAPVIDADLAACVVCDGLQCTTVCPSGALLPLQDPTDIRMGSAFVYDSACLRSNDEPCTLCVDRCPIGRTALIFASEGPPLVLDPGCVGCGVCQLACPTDPKAIVVRPH